MASPTRESGTPSRQSFVTADLEYQSYFVGQLNWLGYSVIGAGFSTLSASQILALAVLKHPEYVVKQWHIWIIAEGLLLLVCLFNIYGMKVRRKLAQLNARR